MENLKKLIDYKGFVAFKEKDYIFYRPEPLELQLYFDITNRICYNSNNLNLITRLDEAYTSPHWTYIRYIKRTCGLHDEKEISTPFEELQLLKFINSFKLNLTLLISLSIITRLPPNTILNFWEQRIKNYNIKEKYKYLNQVILVKEEIQSNCRYIRKFEEAWGEIEIKAGPNFQFEEAEEFSESLPDIEVVTKNKNNYFFTEEKQRGCSCTNGCLPNNGCSCCPPNYTQPIHREDILGYSGNIYECGDYCSCAAENCKLRGIQKQTERKDLYLFKTENKGWGVKCENFLKKGTFVSFYIGEIINANVFQRRAKITQLYGYFYMFGLDCNIPNNMKDKIKGIDTLYYCNIARFFNHSCEQNLKVVPYLKGNGDILNQYLAIYSGQDIPPHQELTLNYAIPNNSDFGSTFVCYCEKKNCRYK